MTGIIFIVATRPFVEKIVESPLFLRYSDAKVFYDTLPNDLKNSFNIYEADIVINPTPCLLGD